MSKKESRERYEKLSRQPCLVPQIGGNASDCGGRLENNHLTSIASRERDDLRTIRLCTFHHQAQSPLPHCESYHKGKKLFFDKYGNDDELLAKQNEILESGVDYYE